MEHLDLQFLRQWIGREQVVDDVLAMHPARGMAALLDRDADWVRPGASLPPLWHWLYLLGTTPQSRLGSDGHARRGDFLPPVPLPRRVWAGGRLRFPGSLTLGATARRRSRVLEVLEKHGRQGRFILVTVRHLLEQERVVVVEEEQDLVYRQGAGSATRPAPPAGVAAEPAAQPAPAEFDPTDWSEPFLPSPVALFRFSALTFNGHRIHYDEPYATTTEGYRGLIVHGPLLALLLLEAAQRACDQTAAAYECRALAPAVAGAPIAIEGRRTAGGAAVRATGRAGRPIMSGFVRW